MIARFTADGAELKATRSEYIFIYLALSYVIDGVPLDDADFRNILGLPRAEAEAMFESLVQQEARAREVGQHWNPARPTE